MSHIKFMLFMILLSPSIIFSSDGLFTLSDVLKAKPDLALAECNGNTLAFNGQEIIIRGERAQIRGFNLVVNKDVQSALKSEEPTKDWLVDFGSILLFAHHQQRYSRDDLCEAVRFLRPSCRNSGYGNYFVFEETFFLDPKLGKYSNPVYIYSLTLKFKPTADKIGFNHIKKVGMEAPRKPGNLTVEDILTAIPQLENETPSWKVFACAGQKFIHNSQHYQLVQAAFEDPYKTLPESQTFGEYLRAQDLLTKQSNFIQFYDLKVEDIQQSYTDTDSHVFFKLMVRTIN